MYLNRVRRRTGLMSADIFGATTSRHFQINTETMSGGCGARLQVIVAACEGGGIGQAGELPWRLRQEMAHFARTTRATTRPGARNAVLMGRKTWESIPERFRSAKPAI